MRVRKFGEIVAIFVGTAKPFMVHKSVLVKASFFDQFVGSRTTRVGNHEIRMPQDDPEAFEDLVGFLYFGASALDKYNVIFDEAPEAQQRSRAMMRRLERLYQLAEKTKFEELHNQTIDFVINFKTYVFYPSDLDRFSLKGPKDCAWF